MKETVILGRLVRWTADGLGFEVDPRHRKALMNHFGFEEGVKGAATNGDKDRKEEEGDEEDMERGEAKMFRGLAARMNHLAQDPVQICSIQQRKSVGRWQDRKGRRGGG
jgi:hypothetical protein